MSNNLKDYSINDTEEEETSNRSLGILLILAGIVGMVNHLFFSEDKYYQGDDLFASKTMLASEIEFHENSENEGPYYYFRTTDQKCKWAISEGSLTVMRNRDQFKRLSAGDPVKVTYKVANNHLLQDYNTTVRVIGFSSGSNIFVEAKEVRGKDSDSFSGSMILSSVALVGGIFFLIAHYRKKNAENEFDPLTDDSSAI